MTDALLALLQPGPAMVYELAERLHRPVDVVQGWLRGLEREGTVRQVLLGDPPIVHWSLVLGATEER